MCKFLTIFVLEITFIASNAELQFALDVQQELRGLAVSSDFYATATNDTKEKIDELAKFLLNQGLRPVFIYGYNIDSAVLDKLFGSRGETSCRPLVMVGVFPTLYLSGVLDGATVEMCGGDESIRSEEWFRNWIFEYGRKTKEDLKNRGYAILP